PGDSSLPSFAGSGLLRTGLAAGTWLRSHSGRALRIGGSDAKLCSGGGDEVAHSSVQPSQGLSLARAPYRRLRHTFQRNTSIASAMVNAPTVSEKLSAPQPGRSG